MTAFMKTAAIDLGVAAAKKLGNHLEQEIINKPSLHTTEDALNREMDNWEESLHCNTSAEIKLENLDSFVECIIGEGKLNKNKN